MNNEEYVRKNNEFIREFPGNKRFGLPDNMAQNFGDNSTQASLLYNGSSYSSGTTVTLTDSDGNKIASVKSTVKFASVLISTPKMAKGTTYTLKLGSDSESCKMSSLVTTIGSTGMGGGGMFENVYKSSSVKKEEDLAKVEVVIETLYNYFIQHPEKLPEDCQMVVETEGVNVAVKDHIAGMTDRYAMNLYTELFVPVTRG